MHRCIGASKKAKVAAKEKATGFTINCTVLCTVHLLPHPHAGRPRAAAAVIVVPGCVYVSGVIAVGHPRIRARVIPIAATKASAIERLCPSPLLRRACSRIAELPNGRTTMRHKSLFSPSYDENGPQTGWEAHALAG